MGGCSEVIMVQAGASIQVTIEQQEPESHSCLWTGETRCMEYEFDPENFISDMKQQQRKGRPTSGSGDLVGEATVRVSVQDVAGHRRRRQGAKQQTTFSVDVVMHEFPRPSPPTGLKFVSRTRTAVSLRCEAPSAAHFQP